MNRVAFSIFNVDIYYYSLFILTGIIIAYFLIKFETKKHNIDFNIVSNLLFYTIIIGILGARVYYVIFNISYYANNLLEIINIRNGGLAIHGGIISAIIFIYYYTKKHNLNFIRILDIFAPGVIIAQAIGRWGNFFNQEAYGKAVAVSKLYKLHIPKFIINGMKIDGIYYYPTFYFESIWCKIGNYDVPILLSFFIFIILFIALLIFDLCINKATLVIGVKYYIALSSYMAFYFIFKIYIILFYFYFYLHIQWLLVALLLYLYHTFYLI